MDPSARFCPKCGATLTSSAAPTGGAPPVDIRQKVDEDRGFLKRLQLLVPGFRGYRQGEDIRAADSLLRRQVADKVHDSLSQLQDARSDLVNANQFSVLTEFSNLIAELQQLEGHIRHGEQGYTGISPAVRMQAAELDRLYEYDFGFAEAGDQLGVAVRTLRTTLASANSAAIPPAVNTVRAMVTQLQQAFQARIKVVEGIRV